MRGQPGASPGHYFQWVKACSCQRATASGPRLVLRAWGDVGDSFTVTATWAAMACDRCDEPWEERSEREPVPR